MDDKVISFEQAGMGHLLKGLPEMGPEYDNAGPPMADEPVRPEPVAPEGYELAPEAKVMIELPDGTIEYLSALDVEGRVKRLIVAEYKVEQQADRIKRLEAERDALAAQVAVLVDAMRWMQAEGYEALERWQQEAIRISALDGDQTDAWHRLLAEAGQT